MIICVIKDSLVESYHVPVFCANAAVAIRIFATECNRAAADNLIFTNRGDFDLLKIGSIMRNQVLLFLVILLFLLMAGMFLVLSDVWP